MGYEIDLTDSIINSRSSFEDKLKHSLGILQKMIVNLEQEVKTAEQHKLSTKDVNEYQEGLKQIYEISNDIDNLLRDWKIELTGDPVQYNLSKSTYDKYQRLYNAQISGIDEIHRRANELLCKTGDFINPDSTADLVQDDDFEGDFEGDYSNIPYNATSYILDIGKEKELDNYGITSYVHKFKNVDTQIAQETAMGIGHIQSQMYEVNQIFRNIASMVNEQGDTIQNLETSIDNTVYTTKQAIHELRKAYNSNSYRIPLLMSYGLPFFLFLLLVLILMLYFFILAFKR
ncbi:SNARE domain-containing protein [Cryptosporidium andersoni]|uniref:SNARE domain-containing protein n=1 Tax=Cryptosporidium andersoni TaxID=117008 RepID=A0A1J4MNT4_9CRYT|nr:SNARE domain-containing protein [Cryptosporidium andersoni]